MAEALPNETRDANGLTDEQVKLLDALWRKGPAMPMELAVRTLSLPEEINQPLEQLEKKGLVEVESIDGGAIAQSLVFLSKKGARTIESYHE
jgi:DNA-binding MarR family transcriptional regulator